MYDVKTIKIIMAVIAFNLLVFSWCAVVRAEESLTDIPEGWSKSAVEEAVSNGLMVGANGRFMPKAYVPRSQVAAIVNRAFGAETQADISSAVDVDENAWYKQDMSKAVGMGTMVITDGMLAPNRYASREEVMAILARAFKLKPVADLSPLSEFSDADSISPWAEKELAAMVTAGYVNGSNGKLNPKGHLTREQFAQIMHQMVKEYYSQKGEYTTKSQGNVMVNTDGVTIKDSSVSGDLIIGEGVKNGSAVLTGTTVNGRTIVKGGGSGTIHIDSSNLGELVIARVDGAVRVSLKDGTVVEGVYIDDGKDDVVIDGNAEKIVVASDVPVTLDNCNVGTVEVVAEDASVTVSENSTVTSITAKSANALINVNGAVESVITTEDAHGTKIHAEVGGTVNKIEANAENTLIYGNGDVLAVMANANNIGVYTGKTEVVVASGATGVIAGDTPVEGGASITTSVAVEPPTGGTGGTDTTETNPQNPPMTGGGGGGGSGTVTETALNGTVTLKDASVKNITTANGATYNVGENTVELITALKDYKELSYKFADNVLKEISTESGTVELLEESGRKNFGDVIINITDNGTVNLNNMFFTGMGQVVAKGSGAVIKNGPELVYLGAEGKFVTEDTNTIFSVAVYEDGRKLCVLQTGEATLTDSYTIEPNEVLDVSEGAVLIVPYTSSLNVQGCLNIKGNVHKGYGREATMADTSVTMSGSGYISVTTGNIFEGNNNFATVGTQDSSLYKINAGEIRLSVSGQTAQYSLEAGGMAEVMVSLNVNSMQELWIKEGATFIIPEGVVVNNSGVITNDGILVVDGEITGTQPVGDGQFEGQKYPPENND